MVKGVNRRVILPGETEYPESDPFSSPPPLTPFSVTWPAAMVSVAPQQRVPLCPEASGSPKSLSACLSPSKKLEGLRGLAPVVSVTPPNSVLAHTTGPAGLCCISDRLGALTPQATCICRSLLPIGSLPTHLHGSSLTFFQSLFK